MGKFKRILLDNIILIYVWDLNYMYNENAWHNNTTNEE